MSDEREISGHWSMGGLAETILGALEEAKIDSENLTAQDLEPIDNMHGGGAGATREMKATQRLSRCSVGGIDFPPARPYFPSA